MLSLKKGGFFACGGKLGMSIQATLTLQPQAKFSPWEPVFSQSLPVNLSLTSAGIN